MTRWTQTPAERLAAKTVERESGCKEWTGGVNRTGYGHLQGLRGEKVGAHRLAYELAHGPIPPGLVVMHSCDNPPCVNPEHLSLGTRKDNQQDMVAKGRSTRGAKDTATKLTVADVLAIRSRAADGETQASLAREFGVSHGQVHRIVKRTRWEYV